VLGKRSHGTDDPVPTDLLWLTEVHSKIWNQKGLRPRLFRDVVVTEAHYSALQKRLNDLHPDRGSPAYDCSNPDILRAKLDILRSPTPAEASSPRHPDNNDDRKNDYDKDDPEIKSLFPFPLRFLDLSPLGLEQGVTPRFPLPLLLREEYTHISELIKKEYPNSGGSVLVSGQPGTGEFLVSLSYRIYPALPISRKDRVSLP